MDISLLKYLLLITIIVAVDIPVAVVISVAYYHHCCCWYSCCCCPPCCCCPHCAVTVPVARDTEIWDWVFFSSRAPTKIQKCASAASQRSSNPPCRPLRTTRQYYQGQQDDDPAGDPSQICNLPASHSTHWPIVMVLDLALVTLQETMELRRRKFTWDIRRKQEAEFPEKITNPFSG